MRVKCEGCFLNRVDAKFPRKKIILDCYYFFFFFFVISKPCFHWLFVVSKSFDIRRYLLVNEKIDSWEIARCKSFNGLVVSRDELSSSLFDRFFLLKLDIYVSRIRSHTCEHDRNFARAKLDMKKFTSLSLSLFSVLVGRYLNGNASRLNLRSTMPNLSEKQID